MLYPAVNGLWCLLFLYAAAVQFNDPDPLQWVALYGIAALFCGLAAAGRLPWRPAAGYAFVAALLAIAAFVTRDAAAKPMGGFPQWGVLNQEGIREALGLTLVSLWMAVLGGWTYLRHAAEPEDG